MVDTLPQPVLIKQLTCGISPGEQCNSFIHHSKQAFSEYCNFINYIYYIINFQVMYPKMYLYKRIVQSRLFIDSHYAEAIDLDNIADEALFSRFHFIRLFSSIYGQTPHQYLTSLRIEKSKELLRAGESVSSTCFAVGFVSLGSFTSLFKRRTGQNPSLYRRQMMEREDAIKQNPLHFIPGCFAEQKGWKNSNFEEMKAC